jgi:ribonuclease P protein component
MMVQARKRTPDEATGIRVGFTCSKKVGNAVARNRAKRRLREAARAVLPVNGHDGWDYVLIGRAETTAARPYEALLDDLRYALRKVHSGRK